MKKYARIGFVVTLSTLMTATLAFAGGAPLRSLRKAMGPAGYWGINVVMVAMLFLVGAPVLAGSYLAIFASVGLFAELEDMGFSIPVAGLGALGLISIVAASSFAFWIGSYPGTWLSLILAVTQPLYDQVLQFKPDLEITHEGLLLQLPGAFVLMLMVAIYFSLLGERLFSRWLEVDRFHSKALNLFKVPDELIWVRLGSMLAAFYQHDLKPITYIGSNVLMITIGIYFFQGLAVTAHFFNRIKLGLIWRALAFAILASQLVVLVAMVGVADMWLEFREGKKQNPIEQRS